MNTKLWTTVLIIVILACIIGAGVSVAMLIRAVQWSEWGRVVLYSVTTGICVEAAVLAIGKRKNKETS